MYKTHRVHLRFVTSGGGPRRQRRRRVGEHHHGGLNEYQAGAGLCSIYFLAVLLAAVRAAACLGQRRLGRNGGGRWACSWWSWASPPIRCHLRGRSSWSFFMHKISPRPAPAGSARDAARTSPPGLCATRVRVGHALLHTPRAGLMLPRGHPWEKVCGRGTHFFLSRDRHRFMIFGRDSRLPRHERRTARVGTAAYTLSQSTVAVDWCIAGTEPPTPLPQLGAGCSRASPPDCTGLPPLLHCNNSDGCACLSHRAPRRGGALPLQGPRPFGQAQTTASVGSCMLLSGSVLC